jgi:hypothetical protein
MHNIGSYEDRINGFDWKISERNWVTNPET